MKQNNKKFNNVMHKFVGVLDKCEEKKSPFEGLIGQKDNLHITEKDDIE